MGKNPHSNQAPRSDDDDIIFDEEGAGAGQDHINKIKDLKEKLKICQTEKSEYLAGWQRSQADYINLKKEAERKQTDILLYSKTSLLEELIPLADSFEMAMADKKTWNNVAENWRKGIEFIYNKLETIFTDNNLEVIEDINITFNPLEHEGIEIVDTVNEQEDNQVLEIVKKGYRMKDRVIRPAQVKVGHYRPK